MKITSDSATPSSVLVVNEHSLVQRTVTTGMRNWEYCEILEGLETGELVVSSLDRKEIRPGAIVEYGEPGSVP